MESILTNPLVAFVLLVGVVVLIHELGHYLAGKALGIDAEEFSIGFGPKAFGFVWLGTEFKVCWLPLGGYVRFYGSEIGGEIPRERAHRALLESPVYKRALISAAGPFANLVLSFFVMTGISKWGMPQPAPVVSVLQGSPSAQAGLQDGDRILSIAGKSISTWKELNEKVTSSPNAELSFGVRREKLGQSPQEIEIRIVPREDNVKDTFGESKKAGRIGVSPALSAPRIVVLGDSALWQAGLRSGDKIDTVSSQKVRHAGDLNEVGGLWTLHRLGRASAEELQKQKLKSEKNKKSASDSGEPAVDSELLPVDLGQVAPKMGQDFWTTDLTLSELENFPKADARLSALEAWKSCGLSPGDTLISGSSPEVPEANAKFRTATDLYQFLQRVTAFQNTVSPGSASRIVFEKLSWDASQINQIQCEIPRRLTKDSHGHSTWTLDFPFKWMSAGAPPITVIVKSEGLLDAFVDGAKATGEQVGTIFTALKKLFSGSLPMSNLGGPIAIARVAGDAASGGLLVFLLTISWMSINIGLFNLLPLPALDGGALLMHGVEAAYGRPLPVKVQANVQKLGFIIILSLIVLVFYNDILRLFTQP